MIFKSKQKKFEGDLKKLWHKRLKLLNTESVKHLGVKIDKNLNLKYHANDISINKLNTEPMLSFSKWENVSLKTLKSMGFKH